MEHTERLEDEFLVRRGLLFMTPSPTGERQYSKGVPWSASSRCSPWRPDQMCDRAPRFKRRY